MFLVRKGNPKAIRDWDDLVKPGVYDYVGATGIAMVMLAVSFVLLLAINLLQGWSGRRREASA